MEASAKPHTLDLYASRETLRAFGVALVKACDASNGQSGDVRLELPATWHAKPAQIIVGNDDMEGIPADSDLRDLVLIDGRAPAQESGGE